MTIFRNLMTAAAPLALCACALSPPPQRVAAPVPPQWFASPAHNGSLTDLASWWQRQGDPLLVQLIDAAQGASPNVSTARARIAQSRAERVAAGAALLPSVDAGASIIRSNQQSALPMGTTSQAAFQAAWEIDLFGGRRAERRAADERFVGAQAGWHEARVSVAAEVANQYYALRACGMLLAVADQDAASRADSARLTQLTTDAGFQSPANAALARASAAEGKARATLQRALCDLDVKALVALTALPEPELRQKLISAVATPAAPIEISALPADTLAQRPDVFNAEREVAAASFDVGSAQSQRYPRLTLQGSVGAGNLRSGGVNTTIDTWSIGPLALTVPVFDAGARAANVDAASARYDNAVVTYRAVARQAVREVEDALVTLHSTAGRSGDAQVALEGYRYSFRATEDLYKNGLASLLQLEDARRTYLAAEIALVNLQRERNGAWIALYRAAGGGWNAAAAN
ncbi:RND transporter [Massilia eurypsychrophila]|uniref:RND transporter n=1 Tax=Massilia eurypsychrophila TaxID=1485217 RepID=A0A2G8TFW8_9BURK|nr:efflux transporter outer membrane subunit [Massilia eurypsychrophila]PIL44538.1 RND transporter [Massilia eurypsychrophila]